MHNIQVQRDIRIVLIAGEGGPGHGPVLLLLESAAEFFFSWDSGIPGWWHLGLPRNMAAPLQHSSDCNCSG